MSGVKISSMIQEREERRQERIKEYEICKHRGHQPDQFIRTSQPPQNCCKWCGTYYGTRTEDFEHGAPE